MRSRRVSRREVVAVVVSGIVIAVVMTWPLASQMNEILPGMGRIGDPYLHTWQIAWEAHALETDPGNYFQANTHWPHEDSLAFIDTTTGYAPAGLIGDGVEAAVVRYNVLYLFAYSLAFIGAYLLARQLGVGVGGAFVAAAAFSFAPWRAAQNGHLIVLSSGGIPLALFFLLRGYMHRSVRAVVAGAAVVLWQLSVGFTLGLQFVYLLGGLAAMFAFRLWKKREPDVSRRFLVAVGASTAAVLVGGLLLAIPFLSVGDR